MSKVEAGLTSNVVPKDHLRIPALSPKALVEPRGNQRVRQSRVWFSTPSLGLEQYGLLPNNEGIFAKHPKSPMQKRTDKIRGDLPKNQGGNKHEGSVPTHSSGSKGERGDARRERRKSSKKH